MRRDPALDSTCGSRDRRSSSVRATHASTRFDRRQAARGNLRGQRVDWTEHSGGQWHAPQRSAVAIMRRAVARERGRACHLAAQPFSFTRVNLTSSVPYPKGPALTSNGMICMWSIRLGNSFFCDRFVPAFRRSYCEQVAGMIIAVLTGETVCILLRQALHPLDALLFVKRIGGSGLSLGDGD
jgi:hypothetical protein